MAKTKIKEDKYGLYVRTGGYLFRPYRSQNYNLWAIDNGKTAFVKGDEIKAHHVLGSIMGIIKTNDIEECWESHGAYIVGKSTGEVATLKSIEVWKSKGE